MSAENREHKRHKDNIFMNYHYIRKIIKKQVGYNESNQSGILFIQGLYIGMFQ